VIEETDRVFDGYQLASAPDLKIMRIDPTENLETP